MTAVSRLAHALGRADQSDAAGVFLQRDDAQLYALARAADDRFATGRSLGPLDGQLVIIKGNIDLKGLPNTAGSVSFISAPATVDAPLVQRLISQGALPMGHANLSEFAFSGLGLNPNFGNPVNTLDEDRVPGGSSSGCATAIGLGIANLAIGTDTSGSTRVPAAYQGIIGFRPSMGRYDTNGILPLAKSLDTPGPMSRTMSGLLLLDEALRIGPDICPAELPPRLIAPVLEDLVDASSDIHAMYEQTVISLQDLGWRIERRALPALESVKHLFEKHGTLVGSEAPETLSQFTSLDHLKIDPNIRKRLRLSHNMTLADKRLLSTTRRRLQAQLKREIGDALLVFPTVPTPPPKVSTVLSDPDAFAFENARALSLTMLGAYLDMPSLALPVGHGRPGHSLTVSGTTGGDNRVLDLGAVLETQLRNISTRVYA